ncbi:MAG: hypothetical protein AAGC77_03160 [Pseudomonadota bacterium]
MGYDGRKGAPRISADRLASLAGGGAGAPVVEVMDASVAAPVRPRRSAVEPDLSRIRPRGVDETPAQRKKRLAAKTINFGATITARIIILFAAGLYFWDAYQYSGQVSRGLAMGMFLMTADLGRVLLKAAEPGSK